MAVLPRASTCLDLTISIPGFPPPSSPSPHPGDQNGGGGGDGGNLTLRDFDINQPPAGADDQEDQWVTGSMELEGEEDDDDSPTANGHHGSGGGSGGGGPPPKKLRLTKQQSRLLEESFRQNHTLNPKQKEALAMQLTLTPRQVEVWFQNRRARSKLKQTEMECEYLKRWFGSLTEQNRKLQKEVEELRSMKVSPPTVLSPHTCEPLPASTLSMCPRCERVTTATTRATTSTNNVAAATLSAISRHPSAVTPSTFLSS